ncbi:uncharacterized protein LOC133867351 [Alnus glutinosa]|uniref:uncharacterized protein LOC133867351 n=1 Tax=Alnus glutinosa TaxID=3517 RepID=UPI002D7A2E1D|nr:uncharacterized protein LOC133867351 [Alnus glutinosa]
MVLLKTPQHGSGSSSKLTSAGLFISMSAFMALCAKKAGRLSRKLKPKPMSDRKLDLKSSPLVTRPKQLITTLSNKAISFMHPKLDKEGSDAGGPELKDWGDGGVWQRTILMGDKCEPLDFSGVIYYDSDGKQLNEVPIRSPRASPLPGYLTRAGKSEL